MMFKFESVKKEFSGDFWTPPFIALSDVSFEVDKSSIVGFLGANGAGKTTAIKILLQFLKPTTGGVKYSEELGKTRNEIFSKIGYLPERPYFYPDLTGNEFLYYIGHLNDLKSDMIKKEINRWANFLKINFALDRKLRHYSKGMLQRLGFAASLINNPELLVLDEPLAGLDPIGRKEFKEVMTTLASEGKTIFFSSHIIHDVEEICKDVVILEKGKKVYSGNVQRLINEHSSDDFIVHLITNNISTPELFVKELDLDGSSKYIVKGSKMNAALKFISENDIKIIKAIKKTPSLEEIVYKVEK